MTKPEDIPQWAWEKADEACSLIPSGDGDTVTVSVGDIARAILSAVEEEREACAAHLEALAKDTPLGHENVQRGRSTYNWLTHCARLIRSRKED